MVQMLCEKCFKDHDGSYGSGRFCSSVCARSFSTSRARKDINRRVSEKLSGRKRNLTEEQRAVVSEQLAVARKMRSPQPYQQRPFDALSLDYKRIRIIEDQDGHCANCNVDEWFGLPIILELDHINGDRSDNRRENLRCLCPNCHSLTPTWRGRNKTKKGSVTNAELHQALRENQTIYSALNSVGMAPKGTNYIRARKLLENPPGIEPGSRN